MLLIGWSRETSLSPPVKYFSDHSKAVLLLWIICVISVLCLSCFRGRLFIAALWSPAGNWLTSWLSFVMFNCLFVTFPCDSLAQVWYLIVLIRDLCPLSYLEKSIHSRLTFIMLNSTDHATPICLEVIKLEYSLRLKIKRNDWLLADTCPQSANHCPLF